MKKISFLLCLIILLFTMPQVVNASKISTIDLDDLSVNITGSSSSQIELKFSTKVRLDCLEIWLNYKLGNTRWKELSYAYNKPINPDNCTVISLGLLENGKYVYHYIFNATTKVTTFDFIFTYQVNSMEINQTIYVTNGNPNILDETFNPMNAIGISFLTTFACAIGTFIIIKTSEKTVRVTDEE